jgi:hypothetical protein
MQVHTRVGGLMNIDRLDALSDHDYDDLNTKDEV